jgi:hypothetical protein
MAVSFGVVRQGDVANRDTCTAKFYASIATPE